METIYVCEKLEILKEENFEGELNKVSLLKLYSYLYYLINS